MADDVSTNYNAVGTAVMELLYANNYLSPSGDMGTKRLSELARLAQATTVLDIGCGLGGPALELTKLTDARVTGIDIVHPNLTQARDIAPNANFACADAQALPFPHGHFDAVIGQDAWCHVPDKGALFNEITRVSTTGATLAFTDWVRLLPASEAKMADVLRTAASPTMATAEEYTELIQSHGFNIQQSQDLTQEYAANYTIVMDRLAAAATVLTQRYGQRVFDKVQQKQQRVCDAFHQGLLGGWLVFATN